MMFSKGGKAKGGWSGCDSPWGCGQGSDEWSGWAWVPVKYLAGKGMEPSGMMGMTGWGGTVPRGRKGGKGSSPGKGIGDKIASSMQTKKIFVGNLPKVPDEENIREYFSSFGDVEEVKMMYNEKGDSKGFCFVTFESTEPAKFVFENYEHNVIDGQWVDCKLPDGGKNGIAGDWLCPVCGDLVFSWRSSCNMCGFGGTPGSPAAPNGGKPGDWICHNCGDLVFSYREKCNKCGTAKHQGTTRLGVKKGDWTCPCCGDLVFATKAHCSLCGTPKPDEEEVSYGATRRARTPTSRPY